MKIPAALQKKRDEKRVSWYFLNMGSVHRLWKQKAYSDIKEMCLQRPSVAFDAGFEAAAKLLLVELMAAKEALKFYGSKDHWFPALNDEGEKLNAFFIRPDYGETIKYCGECARAAISRIDKVLGEEK